MITRDQEYVALLSIACQQEQILNVGIGFFNVSVIRITDNELEESLRLNFLFPFIFATALRNGFVTSAPKGRVERGLGFFSSLLKFLDEHLKYGFV